MQPQKFNFVYPPSFQKATKHRLANRIFKGKVDHSSEQCECCGKKTGQEQVQTSCNIQTEKLSFLGPGVPLFFLYLRYIIILMFLMCIFFMGFAIYSNVISGDCQGLTNCIPDTFNLLSLINKNSKGDLMAVQSYLALVFVVVTIAFFQYFRYKARVLQKECDEVIDSPSDYAIIIRMLPPKVTEKQIRQLIQKRKLQLQREDLVKTKNLEIKSIILSYSLKQYLSTKQQNIDKFKQSVKNETHSQFSPQLLPKPSEPSKIAVVVFESQASKIFFIHKPTIVQRIAQFFCSPCVPLSDMQINEQKISIQRAPQPDDIYWQNAGITVKGGICRKSGIGAASMILLLIGGGLQYGFNILANSITDQSTKSLLSTASSLIITIFNAILIISLQILTKKERNLTLTELQTVFMVKITIFQFLNAGIFVMIAEIAANYKSFSLGQGICSQITIIMILNAIIPNVTLFILSYTEIINKIMRCLTQKQFFTKTQQELNQISLGPAIQIPNKYAYILKTLWLTALYSPLVPIIILISMVGLIVFYFVEKMLYTKSYSLPNTVSSMSFEAAVQMLEYFLITFALGELIIYFYFYNFQYENIPISWTVTIFCTIVLAVLNSALPMQAINQALFKLEQSDGSDVKYSEVESKFEVTYEMTNPAYNKNKKRNNIKDFLNMNKSKSGKNIAIEMANLLNDTATKNNQSIMSQKPLLETSLIQQKSPEKGVQKHKNMKNEKNSLNIKDNSSQQSKLKTEKNTSKVDSDNNISENKVKNNGKQQEKGDGQNLSNKNTEKDKSQQNRKVPLDLSISENNESIQQSPVSQSVQQSSRNTQNMLQPNNKNPKIQKIIIETPMSSHSHRTKNIAPTDQLSKRLNRLRKVVEIAPPLEANYNYNNYEDNEDDDSPQRKYKQINLKEIEQFSLSQDIKQLNYPRFVKKIIQIAAPQSQIVKKQIRNKEEIYNEDFPMIKIWTKTSEKSAQKAAQVDPNIDQIKEVQNIYANLLNPNEKKSQQDEDSKAARQTKLRSFQIFHEDSPIDSKYHKSGGKVDLYQQFISPKERERINMVKKAMKKKNVTSQTKPGKEKKKTPPPKEQKIIREDNNIEKQRENRFTNFIIQDVPIKTKKFKPIIEPSQVQQFQSIKNIQPSQPQKQKHQTQTFDPKKVSKNELERAINETYVDMFGKTSQMNSRSSLHRDPQQLNELLLDKYIKNEIQFLDEHKQKKATYDPLGLASNYKSYFKKKEEITSQPQGFLTKRVVMNYLGSPLTNFVAKQAKKSQQQ